MKLRCVHVVIGGQEASKLAIVGIQHRSSGLCSAAGMKIKLGVWINTHASQFQEQSAGGLATAFYLERLPRFVQVSAVAMETSKCFFRSGSSSVGKRRLLGMRRQVGPHRQDKDQTGQRFYDRSGFTRHVRHEAIPLNSRGLSPYIRCGYNQEATRSRP
jgi:hypothetical protein